MIQEKPVGMDAIRIENIEPTLSPRGAGRKDYEVVLLHPAKTNSLPASFWLISWGVFLAVLLITFSFWGSDMGFPTTVSQTEVETSNGGTLILKKTIRETIADGIDEAVFWLTREASWLFDGINSSIAITLVKIESILSWFPWPTIVVALGILAFAVGGKRMLAFAVVAMIYMGFMDMWDNMIDTVSLMVVAVVIAIAGGLPLGVLMARNQVANNLMRPVLDGMQTMPSFVYLLPGLLFFGLGNPAGIFATIIYAIPPVIRLTNLGIRQVSPEAIEAAQAFGSTPFQMLVKVQVPMSLPTIMAGINQTTMMALAMVTIASMVGAGGLGDNVLRALQKNQPGNGVIAGMAIVFLAILFDRLTQSVAEEQQSKRGAG